MNNSQKYYLRSSLQSTAGLFSTGAIYQTFLILAGVTTAQVGTLTSVSSIVQVVAMLVFSGLADRLSDRRILSASGWLMLPGLLMPLTLLIINFTGNHLSGSVVFLIALALTILCQFFTGVTNILSYKLPYLIIPMKQYAQLVGTSGVVSGVCSFLASFAVTWLINHLVYQQAMTIGFSVAAALVFMTAMVNFTFRPIASPQAAEKRQNSSGGFFEIFRLPSFRLLLLPNLSRGLCTGVMAMLTVIGIHELALNESQTALMSTIMVIASIGGGLFYRLLSSRFTSALLCLAGAILQLMANVLMLPFGSYPIFLCCVCAAMTGQLLVDNTVPVLLTTFVPYSKIGQYTSYRMVLTTGASSLASFLTGMLLGPVSAITLIVVAGLLQLYCGVSYYRFDRKARRAGDPFEADAN